MTDSHQGRLLALDVGERRIGVAVSDELGLLARGVTTIQRTSAAQALDALAAQVDQWRPTTIVVGLPRNMDGSLGPQAERVMRFARDLAGRVGLPVLFWDERLSSVSAEEILRRQGIGTRDHKARIDAVAAAVILQEYLDAQRSAAPDYGLLPPDAPADTEPPRRGGRSRRGQRASREESDH